MRNFIRSIMHDKKTSNKQQEGNHIVKDILYYDKSYYTNTAMRELILIQLTFDQNLSFTHFQNSSCQFCLGFCTRVIVKYLRLIHSFPNMSSEDQQSSRDQDKGQESKTGLTGYIPYHPSRIVTSYSEAKECACTTKTETNWEQVEKVLKKFRFVDNNPFGRNPNKWSSDFTEKPQIIVKRTAGSPSNYGGDENGEKFEVKRYELKACSPTVYLAGSYEEMGFSQKGAEKPCDQLKCKKCSNRIESFDNYGWKPSSSVQEFHRFLRKNMPELEKICSKLIKSKGVRAYACYCTHINIEKLTSLNSHPEIYYWDCGKHEIELKDDDDNK